MKSKTEDPILKIVDEILKRPIEWVDFENMDIEAKRTWGAYAKDLLENPIFVSLFGKTIGKDKTNGELVRNLIEYIARKSASHEETVSIRVTLAAFERVRERVEDMIFKERRVSTEHTLDPI